MNVRKHLHAGISFLTLFCFTTSAFSSIPADVPKSPFVILIQENHSDPGAQKRIAEVIQYYQSKMDIPLLAVEGASGEIPVEELRNYPDSEAKRKSSEVLMNQLILDGASYAAIFSSKPMRFIGVENPDLYQENLKIYQKAKNDSTANEFLRERREKLDKDLKKISPALRKFYETGDDFEKIIASSREFNEAVSGNVLPTSKIYSSDFLLDHPEIRRSLAMQEFQQKLSMKLLLQIRERIKNNLIATDFDRKVDLEKTKLDQWENISRLKALREDLNADLPPALSKAREFYDLARKRDAAMAENLIKNLRTSAILVTGGFHTAGIAQILRSRGISYQIVTPKMNELHCEETLYERRLAGDLSIQTLAAPRAVANPDFRGKLIQFWNKEARSVNAASLGRRVERILVVGGSENRANLIAKMNISREFQISEASGIDQALERIGTAFSENKAFDLVISFLQVEDGGWFTSATTADLLYHRMKKDLGVPPPLAILATERNIKDRNLYPVLRVLFEWDKNKPEGFLGYFRFELGYFRSTFEGQIVAEIEKKYAKLAPKRPPTQLKEIPMPKPVPKVSTPNREKLKNEIAAEELAVTARAKAAQKLKEEEAAAEKKKVADEAEARRKAKEAEAKYDADFDKRLAAAQAEEAAERAAEAEKRRAEAAAIKINELENPVISSPADSAVSSSLPERKWGQLPQNEVGEDRQAFDPTKTQPPAYADPLSAPTPPPVESAENPLYPGGGSDHPPIIGTGSSLGKIFLDQIQRATAWFNRADRLNDSVVFLVRKQTLAEMTGVERGELNYHLKQNHRRILILHDREDKDLNLFGLEGRVQHGWGSAEDYVQVLHRARAPHVVYLSGTKEQIYFQEPGVVNVKHALFAPTAAVEYLFQGEVDFYGIWKKENGRLELILSEKVEMLFQEIAARRWTAVSA